MQNDFKRLENGALLDFNMEILFESENFLVCVKPVGVLCQSNGKNGLPDLLQEEGFEKLFVVHRLDKNVSGVVVLARSSFAAAELSRQIQNGSFLKHYVLLCHGRPGLGNMEDLLFKDNVKNKAYVVKRQRKGVRKASLSFETLKEGSIGGVPVSLCGVDLHTGRFHQIRVQFASRGFVLVGDHKYGAKDEFKAPCLFCDQLSFVDVDTGERLTFKKEEDFGAILG